VRDGVFWFLLGDGITEEDLLQLAADLASWRGESD
jgi:hypothetical protein